MSPASPPGTRVRPALWLAILLVAVPVLGGCGGGDGGPLEALGTVALRNETDQGMAPLTVTQVFLAPAGTGAPGDNLLAQPVGPGGVVILGLFPAGSYDAVAVLSSGLNVNFVDQVVAADQPLTLVIPGN